MIRRRIAVGLMLLAGSALPVYAKPDWFGRFDFAGIYADNAINDGEGDDASSLGLRGMVGFETKGRRGGTRVTLTSGYTDYQSGARQDRWSNELGLRQRFELTPRTTLDLSGGVAFNLSTLEYRSADQWNAQARLAFDLSPRSRVRASVGYLERDYDDVAGSSARGLDFGLDYRYRAEGRTFTAAARQERINATLAAFDYDRTTLSAGYSWPVRKTVEATVGVRAQRTEYGGQPANPLTGQGQRRDWTVRPEASLVYDPAGPFDVSLDYRYASRRSNNDAFDRDGQRLALTVGYKF